MAESKSLAAAMAEVIEVYTNALMAIYELEKGKQQPNLTQIAAHEALVKGEAILTKQWLEEP